VAVELGVVFASGVVEASSSDPHPGRRIAIAVARAAPQRRRLLIEVRVGLGRERGAIGRL
jgi:hypothetical protein